MDKNRHTSDNHELDDINQLILELKDLSGDSDDSFDYRKTVPQHEKDASAEPPAAEIDHPLEEERIAPVKRTSKVGNDKTVRKPKNTASPISAENRNARKTGMLPLWLVAVIDILVGGAVILTFAFFHHVLPAMNTAQARQEALLNATEPPVIATEAPVLETPEEIVTEAPTEPDLRTEWQKKFEEHFSDEVVRTENSYKSPNVSITVETITYGEGKNKQTYHVADIYIGSMDNFVTYTANNEVRSYDTQDVLEMSRVTDALIAISGDFITYQKSGFLMRNGIVYKETTNNVSICALFPDGTMETYEPREYTVEDIKNRGAVQVWSFGPTLLDENGQMRKKYDMPRAVSYYNPRSAIGYYEPGHYCFVVVDGRQSGYAKGLTIPELAQIFVDLGCTKAYNLDGGGSAVMTFDQKLYSQQSNGGRDLGDILVIRETPEFLAAHPEAASPNPATVTEETNIDVTEAGEGIG